MTAEEKVEIRTMLAASMAMLTLEVDGLDEDQWHFIPATGGWSIAQIADHVAYVETNIVHRLQHQIQTAQPDAAIPEATDRKEVILLRGVPNRSRKAEMPPIFEAPTGAGEGAALRRRLQEVRENTLDFVTGCTVDLRYYGQEHFVFKMLNGGQWLLLIALHAQRHAAQIAEIKQAPDYPNLSPAVVAENHQNG